MKILLLVLWWWCTFSHTYTQRNNKQQTFPFIHSPLKLGAVFAAAPPALFRPKRFAAAAAARCGAVDPLGGHHRGGVTDTDRHLRDRPSVLASSIVCARGTAPRVILPKLFDGLGRRWMDDHHRSDIPLFLAILAPSPKTGHQFIQIGHKFVDNTKHYLLLG
ncbi:hypothetical protein niasHS_006040 [Heterodera schachtii]|uniref:Secreted protein n=1 Tax=Heterodera schachtii TaxID=97005 RepID=A0ABD2JVR0_HETSC